MSPNNLSVPTDTTARRRATNPESARVDLGGILAPVAERPSGTVTFLFTDVEGSTAIWEQRPDAMTQQGRR